MKKELSLIDVYCISSGAMISSGIFILPGLAYANTGPLVFVSYFFAGVLALVGALSVIELSTAMPKAGGDYYFVTRSLGPLPGTIAGLFSWAAISLKSAFAIFGMAEIIFLMTGIPLTINALILSAIFVGINIYGVKEAAKLEVTLVFTLIVLLIIYIILGLFNINLSFFNPPTPKGINSMLITSGFVFVSFGGLISVTSISEEVKNPKRNIPLGMLLSVISVTLLYTLVLFVTVGVLPGSKLSASLSPIADTARIFAGTTGYVVITIAAIFAFVTTAIAGIMSASRYPLALSRDSLIPSIFKNLNKRSGMPVAALLLTGIFIVLSLFLSLETLVKAASAVILSANVFANVAVIILRESKIQNYKPSFKVPLYPWIQIISIIMFCVFIVDMGLATIEISLGFLVFSIFVYYLYGKKRGNHESALVHLIARIMNKELASNKLEKELREILVSRDEIQHDEFDEVIKESLIFDIEEAIDRDECFEVISKALTEETEVPTKNLLKMLQKRETESSTVITENVAIPHIIINGQNKFHIVLMRDKNGISFSNEHQEVKAVFAIIGTKDRRNFHLRALAAIAQIIDKKDFLNNWMSASKTSQLKDILLLSQRGR